MKSSWQDIEIRRVRRSPVDWVPLTKSQRFSHEICKPFLQVLDGSVWVTPQKFMDNLEAAIGRGELDYPELPTEREIYSTLLVGVTYGWIDLRLRDSEDEGWDGHDSLSEWR